MTVKEDRVLATRITGIDSNDSALRFCAFLELLTARKGPFAILAYLQKIRHGREQMRYGPPHKMDHLLKTSSDTAATIVATIIRSCSRVLSVAAGCRAREMNDLVNALSVLLALFGERDTGKVFDIAGEKLQSGGELILCYLLLLSTGNPDADQRDQMWRSLETGIVQYLPQWVHRTVGVLLGLVNMTYLCGEGARVFFSWMHHELDSRELETAARRTWASEHSGNPQVWDDLVTMMQSDQHQAQMDLEMAAQTEAKLRRRVYLRHVALQSNHRACTASQSGDSETETESSTEASSGSEDSTVFCES